MNLFRSLDALPESLKSGAVTIGNFDGVHRGHKRIIDRLQHHAARIMGASIVFTFDPHPVTLLRPNVAPPPLTWTERKAELLADLGVDAVIAYPTDNALLSLTAEQFFEQILVNSLRAQAVVEGPNFFFGKDRKGNVEVLKGLCNAQRMHIEIVEPISESEDLVSSSRIRKLISEGKIESANQMLTEPYGVRGTVAHGAGRGADIGFPTANIVGIDTILPRQGVYAGRARLDDRSFVAAINIGPNPTFGENIQKVEAHLLDFSESIYGRSLEVDFIARLRDIQPFANVDELVHQLNNDVDRIRKLNS